MRTSQAETLCFLRTEGMFAILSAFQPATMASCARRDGSGIYAGESCARHGTPRASKEPNWKENESLILRFYTKLDNEC